MGEGLCNRVTFSTNVECEMEYVHIKGKEGTHCTCVCMSTCMSILMSAYVCANACVSTCVSDIIIAAELSEHSEATKVENILTVARTIRVCLGFCVS